MLKVVPQYFFMNESQFPKLYHNYEACLLYKCLEQSQVQGEYFVASHVFTIVLQGQKVIHTSNGSKVVVGPGSAVFLPKDLYMIQDIIAENGIFESWLFFFTDQQIGQFLAFRGEHGNSMKVAQQGATELPLYHYSIALQLFCEGIVPLMSSVTTPGQLVNVKLLELMHLIAAGGQGTLFTEQLCSLKRGRRNIRLLMEQHYDHPLKVEDYAYLSGRSITSFHRDFKAFFGTSPKQWLMDKRMEKASRILREGETSVTTAAYNSGYENISHFIKAFKKRYGVSPGKYSQQHTGLQVS